jgi:hypothetical protein
MESNIELLKENFLKMFPPYQGIGKDQQEAFADKALEINSLLSIKIAKCGKNKLHTLKKALSLIDRLDKFLETLEEINKFYCYYYHVLLSVIEVHSLNE